ncbi:hypothetical protein ACLGL1_04540 [Peptococcus simiae]|uniref:hypothetical protein n=1 Tax=Peptococcus simiae TaxID=1643805 RepID=UPI00397FE03B
MDTELTSETSVINAADIADKLEESAKQEQERLDKQADLATEVQNLHADSIQYFYFSAFSLSLIAALLFAFFLTSFLRR